MHLRSVVIYVAGPYGSHGTVEENIKVATEHAQALWNAGFTVICPHTNTGHFKHEDGGGIPEPDYLDGYMHILPRCDGVYLLPDWEHSHGANKEVALATELEIPIFDCAFRTIADLKAHYEDE